MSTAGGKVIRYYEYDLEFTPELPPGAVAGDVRRQAFCPLCHCPRFFYIDEARTCIQCGREFVFSGKEQKYWYEVRQFHFDSVAIRCVSCRRQRRSEKLLRGQLSAIRARLADNPDDPDALLEDARTRVLYHRRSGEGNLSRAIASARKALRIWPKATEALYWQGIAQHLAGRPEKARPLLQAFVERENPRPRGRKALVREARALLGAPGS